MKKKLLMKVKAPTEIIKAEVTYNIAVCTCYNCNILSLNKPSLSLSLRLIVITGENFRSIGPLEVPDLAALVGVIVVNSQAVLGLQLAIVRIFGTLLFHYC